MLYIVIVAGLLASAVALPALADEGDIEMWVHRARVAYTGRSSGSSDDMVAFIHIRDANLEMVEGALVTAVWTWEVRGVEGTSEELEMKTNEQGIAVFDDMWHGAGDYTICVTGVTKADAENVSWEYNATLNRETCDEFILPPYQP